MIRLLAVTGKRPKPGHPRALLVRVDEIGDFMLWHSFIVPVLQAAEFRQFEWHFCGNKSWKTLFDQFYPGVLQETCWMDKMAFKKKMGYRYRFLREIYRKNFALVINPTYSRDKRYDDSIVMAAKAAKNIGMQANSECLRPYEAGYDAGLYQSVFALPEKPVFEWLRNRAFAEFLTGENLAIQRVLIGEDRIPPRLAGLPENYCVIFPGSRSAARIWPAENFAAIGSFVSKTFGWAIVVAGAPADRYYADDFGRHYGSPVIDLCGKTTLPETLALLRHARCMVSVDTGSIHLAAAVGCPVYGIFNGSQYGRFSPYPAELAPDFHAFYPDEIAPLLADAAIVRERFEFVVDIPYELVSADKIIQAIRSGFRGSPHLDE